MKRNKKQLEARQISADERQEAHAALTPEQRLNKLDRRLGEGIGAKSERARLAKALKALEKTIVESVTAKVEATIKATEQKVEPKMGGKKAGKKGKSPKKQEG